MALLQVDKVSVAFTGLKALTNVSFAVEEGAIHGLIGPNGAGKTTLFNCISGFQRPDAGGIDFDGTDLTLTPPRKRVSLGIGRTFQALELSKQFSVLDNVLMGTYNHYRVGAIRHALLLPSAQRAEREARREALGLLEQVGCSHYAGEAIYGLPYGVLKRVEMARALASRPCFLLLDEPAAGLNQTERVELMALIRATRDRGVTILLVEHDMGLVMSVCDVVTVLNFGVVIANGTPAEVQGNPDVITAYLGLEEEEEEIAKR